MRTREGAYCACGAKRVPPRCLTLGGATPPDRGPAPPFRGSSIGRTSAFGAGCWRFEPSPRSRCSVPLAALVLCRQFGQVGVVGLEVPLVIAARIGVAWSGHLERRGLLGGRLGRPVLLPPVPRARDATTCRWRSPRRRATRRRRPNSSRCPRARRTCHTHNAAMSARR